MASRLQIWIWLALATLLGGAWAQTITASNWTAGDAEPESDDGIDMVVTTGDDMIPIAAILPLTQSAGRDIPSTGLSGLVIFANATNQLNIQHGNIALISCDDSAYVGNIGALDVFGTAEQVNATGIVWYSTEADYCDLEQYSGSYAWIYSMKSANDTQKMLSDTLPWTDDRGGLYMSIGQSVTAAQAANSSTSNSDSGSDSSSSSSQNQQNGNPLGPSPSTAVAMIILYSITGLITALFLVIIITGAVRAHRHPERYGPRNIIGRARQSRARGLARAMLDTIPIVKFGEREPPKPTDVELADGAIASTDVAQSHETTERSEPLSSGAMESLPREPQQEDAERTPFVTEGGIAPATNRQPEVPDADNQGCSICTEDFEIGQDQRVLPCNHRFHPACIDPWLLNVSGTCPLCRIDLRPQPSQSSEPELDEHGNPTTREADADVDDMAPPLASESDPHRTSARRSLMLGLMGIGRPDRLTREERVLALRAYRGQVAARRRREGAEGVAGPSETRQQEEEEERGLRMRLRNAFRVRTRMTERGDVSARAAAGPSESANESDDVPRGVPS